MRVFCEKLEFVREHGWPPLLSRARHANSDNLGLLNAFLVNPLWVLRFAAETPTYQWRYTPSATPQDLTHIYQCYSSCFCVGAFGLRRFKSRLCLGPSGCHVSGGCARSMFVTFSRKSELLGGSFFSKNTLFVRSFLGPRKLVYYWCSFFGMGDFDAICDDFAILGHRKQHHWYLSVGLDRSCSWIFTLCVCCVFCTTALVNGRELKNCRRGGDVPPLFCSLRMFCDEM